MNRLEVETALDREIAIEELEKIVIEQNIQEITLNEARRTVIIKNWEDFIKILIGLDLAYYPNGPKSKPQLRAPLPVIKYDSTTYGAPYAMLNQSILIGSSNHSWKVHVGKKDRPDNQDRKIIRKI